MIEFFRLAQTFRSLLVQYNRDHVVNIVKKRDPLGIKIENEKSKVSVKINKLDEYKSDQLFLCIYFFQLKTNRNVALKRYDLNKTRKVPRKVALKANGNPIEKEVM